MIKYFSILVFAIFGLVSTSQAQSVEHLHGLRISDYHLVQADKLDRPYHIYVRLPEGYDATKKTYPTIYLLDGGLSFPLLTSYYKYLSFGDGLPEVIFVGISYGTDDWQQGNMRSTDFTAPAPDRENYGGAPKFQNFLQNQLIPMVEEKYRSDPKRRIVFGQSLGGQFVLYTAITKPDLFWGHIASNPALHRNLPFFLDIEPANIKTNSRVFAASGENDDDRFRIPAMAWFKHWNAKEDHPWKFKTVTLPGETHMSAPPAAFRQGMNWLFEEG